MTYWTIIPAAGTGVRMQADRPKQYLLLNGEPLLTRVINTFTAHPEIQKVVVVLHAQDHWWSTLQLQYPEKVLTTVGGKARVDSVLLGLSFLRDFASKNDWVMVHDAARPFITTDDITSFMHELGDHEVGGLLGLPVVDTLKKVSDADEVEKTISREHVWQAQTPQCFRYDLLKTAIEKALFKNAIVTDESSAIELLGLKPKMILGSSRNKKITYPEDLR
ncbi:MAG: 2-C-methyl-D-erythritol 4-phosphate cytidylyltransferase [Gammaproteobacteria bacterium RIFCSPLOWO2_02_FULL_42_14]|nr:MAG: 2-C-methyl-D-erythritol 4-phosphate cytidylyltransferase [Gammaproteobacteria bacterium RIFCSPHIGHO2_02_FULL_42_43]OGT28767.1 MAG: 2-C-methyl-D-erythritol 4-phosphate cytidylyltransferase [Gammaproteobacteria bacterium RIFCSPHIGHO2_01_FULL_42_8]OGT51982.1 MAG: 2-C-methyl-D-erythritol 4-phosphate cytidylyltransferase [Gammaproteobacteria bacterium RIFCSPHIGHO2_12_FULL_41_25]OGT61087.1 MAG: 2-C-methyl-D-erythritol 4-phosphate cytidylyltransferase [Gammaproteobacteria bacterium RIFCSPLOWO2_